MNKVKYSKDKLDFATDLRSSVNEYFNKNNITPYGNWKIYLKTVFMIMLYVIPYVLLVTGVLSSALLVLSAWFIMGLGMSGLGMVTMHDANHGSFSSRPWVNRLFGNSLYLLGGFPPNWRYQHNTLHHGFTNIDGHDEDIAPPGILRFSPHQPLKKIHRLQYIYAWFFYSLMTISWIIVKDFRRLKKYKDMGARLSGKQKYSQLLRTLIVSKIVYYTVFLAVPLVTIPVAWYWILLGFLLMHFVGGLVLSSIFQTAHVVPSSTYPVPDTDGELENNWMIHQLYTTCDYSPRSKVFSWFIGGLNYQVEHHLFPNISHIHYKEISRIVQIKAKKYDLPYHVNNTFATAVWQHVKMLKILGQGTFETESSPTASQKNTAIVI